MKHLIKLFSVIAITGICIGITPPKVSAQEVSITLQVFYDQLSPHGHWIHHSRYGYVWIPTAETGFSPYATQGHWRLTNEGWMWISDYSWGWAPFHYGRWDRDARYGWIWLPDTRWGPAWVNWRRANGYYGWSPMEPLRNSKQRDYNRHNDRFIFVNDRDIDKPDVTKYYVDRSKNVTIIKNSTVINNTNTDNSKHVTYNAGPSKQDVQKVTGKEIKEAAVQANDKPGQHESDDKVQIYKPKVDATDNNGKKPAPQKVDKKKNVKKEKQKKKSAQ
jgi:hypothetical protein